MNGEGESMDDWIVVCAHCGKPVKINTLLQHFKNRHNWKLYADGSVNTTSNPFWQAGGI